MWFNPRKKQKFCPAKITHYTILATLPYFLIIVQVFNVYLKKQETFSHDNIIAPGKENGKANGLNSKKSPSC